MGLLLNVAARRLGAPARGEAARDGDERERPPRIVIAAGGTAGHVVPAIAIADALRAEGAEVVFVGGERAEAELVPAAGYELEPIRVEGISRSNPLKAARAVGKAAGALGAARAILAPPRRRRGARRRRLRRRAGRARRASLQRIPLVLDRGRLAPRPDQPRCSRRARAASASRSRSRAATATATCVTGRPVPPTVDRPRRAPAAELGIAPGRDLRARLRRLARRALDQPGRRRGVRRRALPRPARRRHARLRRSCDAPGPHYVLRDYVTPFGDRARRRRPRGRPRRRLGVRARPVRPAGGADPVSARLRPTTRPPTRAGWPTPAPRGRDPRRRADPGAAARRGRRAARDEPRGGRWPPRRRRLARPDAARDDRARGPGRGRRRPNP